MGSSSLKEWLGREGSNLRMAESKSAALPLGDAPIVPPIAERVFLRNTLRKLFDLPISVAGTECSAVW